MAIDLARAFASPDERTIEAVTATRRGPGLRRIARLLVGDLYVAWRAADLTRTRRLLVEAAANAKDEQQSKLNTASHAAKR